jgi:hypothetical protein
MSPDFGNLGIKQGAELNVFEVFMTLRVRPPLRFFWPVVGLVSLSVLVTAFNFVVDPLQLFRPARFYQARYLTDDRTQNAGLIRTHDFDTVFVGSSLAMHFRPSAIDKELGVRSVKLAMLGASSAEQRFVIEAALRRHPKLVVWEMDDWIFHDAPDVNSNAFLPADLYRGNMAGVAGYLLNINTMWESAWLLLRAVKPFDGIAQLLVQRGYLKYRYESVDEINTLPSDLDTSEVYNARKILAVFERYTNSVSRIEFPAADDYDMRVRNFERDTMDLIEHNPQVEFRIYFPPYSILHYMTMRDFAPPQILRTLYKFNTYALHRLVKLPNVKLFDFRDVEEITHNLDNYSDTVHHSPKIDLKLLSFLSTGEYAVDASAAGLSVDRLKKQIETYQINSIRR